MHLSKVTNKLIACTLPRARMELSFSDFSRWHHRYCQSFELFVVVFSETSVCGELCGVSDIVIFSVVCSVVIGASQSIRKTCEWSLLISEILSCVEYKWKYCFYVLYFQVYKEQHFTDFSRWHHIYCQSKFHMITVMASLEITLEYIYIYKHK
jgi:hypothetical protein